jgi:hypothetical protein
VFTPEKQNCKFKPKAETFDRFGQSQKKIPEFICFIKFNSIPLKFFTSWPATQKKSFAAMISVELKIRKQSKAVYKKERRKSPCAPGDTVFM